jgi:hypothetical protein
MVEKPRPASKWRRTAASRGKPTASGPANHPHRRVGALAALVGRWPQYRRLALARPFASKPLVDFLQAASTIRSGPPPHPHLGRRPAPASHLIGRTHALELIANHLAPLAMLEDGMTFRDPTTNSATPHPTTKVKRCALRLFGSIKAAQPWTRRTCHHQALLQIYQDFCLEDFSDCDDCPFPNNSCQWK